MNKVLVLGDIHGRTFWQKPCDDIEKYDRVVFLGDYFDPYDFEGITVPECIENFVQIIDLKKKHKDKVILLLGNHDESYVSKDYYNFSWWHCRHSKTFHDIISKLFSENIDYFQIAHVEGDVLFTHAGVESGWLYKVVKCDETDLNKICDVLNSLQNDVIGLRKLYCITDERGGHDRYGSCIWSDVHDMMWDADRSDKTPIHDVKQVFGHTIQAFYDEDRNIVFGDAIEFGNCKMLDTAKPYELDIDKFKIKVVEN